MYLDQDIERIKAALTTRMRRGWLVGDPDTVTIRPLGRMRRNYLVQFSDGKARQQWRVDGNAPAWCWCRPERESRPGRSVRTLWCRSSGAC